MAAVGSDGAPVRVHLDGSLTTTSGGIEANANATNFTDSEVLRIDASFGFAGNGSVSDSEIQPSAAAEVLGGSTSSLSATGGRVELTAISHNHAKTHSFLASGGLLGAISVAIPSSIVAGATDVHEDGNVVHAAGLTISASSTNVADSEDNALPVVGLAAVAARPAVGQATTDAKTDALIGSGSLHSAGAVNLLAF